MNIRTLLTTTACIFSLAAVGITQASPPLQMAPGTSAKWGTITGHVRDAHGNPLAGVVVKIVDIGEITMTDKDGAYWFVAEDAGTYTIGANGSGFQSAAAKVVVTPGHISALDLNLKVSSTIIVRRVKPGQKDTTIIFVGGSQKIRAVPPQPSPLAAFQGDVAIHSTARSR